MALGRFAGVKRRLEVRGQVQVAKPAPGQPAGADKGDASAITVYDDFAHHPSAMRSTLDGLRRQLDRRGCSGQRILALFEPRSNTMKLGTMKAQLPWSLEHADLAFCHSGGLGWDAAAALAPMGPRAVVAADIDSLVQQAVAAAQAGDHLLCMSNGGFGGVHQKLLEALRQRFDPSPGDGAAQPL